MQIRLLIPKMPVKPASIMALCPILTRTSVIGKPQNEDESAFSTLMSTSDASLAKGLLPGLINSKPY